MFRAFPPEIIGDLRESYSAEPEEYTPYDDLVSPTSGSFPNLGPERVLQRHNSGDTESSGFSNRGYYDDSEEEDIYEPDEDTASKFDGVQDSFVSRSIMSMHGRLLTSTFLSPSSILNLQDLTNGPNWISYLAGGRSILRRIFQSRYHLFGRLYW